MQFDLWSLALDIFSRGLLLMLHRYVHKHKAFLHELNELVEVRQELYFRWRDSLRLQVVVEVEVIRTLNPF